MIEIRPLHADEIPEARLLVPKDAPEPIWPNIWGVWWHAELTHIFSIELRQVVEPMYSKGGNHTLPGFAAMTWIDGFLRAQGRPGYEFFVADSNKRFQEFIKEHLPVREGREKSGLYFFREFKV